MEEDCSEELIITVNKTYKVSGRIMIQDGKGSHIRRFKDEIEHNGNMGDSQLELAVLRNFAADIKEEMEQATLPVQDKPSVEPKKITVAKEPAAAKK